MCSEAMLILISIFVSVVVVVVDVDVYLETHAFVYLEHFEHKR